MCSLLPELSYASILVLRGLTGFFLAGISGWDEDSLRFLRTGTWKGLEFFGRALVLDTALPHLIASFDASLDWRMVIFVTSGLTLVGGALIKFFVGEEPFRKKGRQPKFGAMGEVFKSKEFRAATFGYFGHMWELYAFWAFVLIILAQYRAYHLVPVNI